MDIAGVCPSVEEYTDNCAYVRELGMSLDDEAMDLCNRHQLCYTCVSAIIGLYFFDPI